MVYAELLKGPIHIVTVFNRPVNNVWSCVDIELLAKSFVRGKIFSIILGIIWVLKTYNVRLSSIWNCIIESQFIFRHI